MFEVSSGNMDEIYKMLEYFDELTGTGSLVEKAYRDGFREAVALMGIVELEIDDDE